MRSEIEAMAQDDIQMPFDMQVKNKVTDTQSLFSALVDVQSDRSLPDADSNQIGDFQKFNKSLEEKRTLQE